MKEIKNVCVIGAGSMGRQIALNAAVNGFTVKVKTSKPDTNLAWCEEFLNKGLAKGNFDEVYKQKALSNLSFVTTIEEAAGDADLVIESVVEDEPTKREIFEEINEFAPKDALITTNSSFMGSSRFVTLIDNPGRLANFHYFNPAMYMKLIEIVKDAHTATETVDALRAFSVAIGKKCVVINKEIDGFIVNRLIRAIQKEAFFLYEEGYASFEDIDTAAEKGLNHPMGPFRLMDLTGLDISYVSRQSKYEITKDPADAPPQFLKEKYEKGEFGRKTGKGWYDYSKK